MGCPSGHTGEPGHLAVILKETAILPVAGVLSPWCCRGHEVHARSMMPRDVASGSIHGCGGCRSELRCHPKVLRPHAGASSDPERNQKRVYHTALAEGITCDFIHRNAQSIPASFRYLERATTPYASSSYREGLTPRVPILRSAKSHPLLRERQNRSSATLDRVSVYPGRPTMKTDTYGTVNHLYCEVNTLGFQPYRRVLAPCWFYLSFGESHPDVVQPEVALDRFVD